MTDFDELLAVSREILRLGMVGRTCDFTRPGRTRKAFVEWRRVVDSHGSCAVQMCTGMTALWCPVHGDCTCEPGRDGTASLTDDDCSLHGPRSIHGMASG